MLLATPFEKYERNGEPVGPRRRMTVLPRRKRDGLPRVIEVNRDFAKVAQKSPRGSIDKGGTDDKIPPPPTGKRRAFRPGGLKKLSVGEPVKAADVRL